MEIHETTKCPDCLSRDIVHDLSRGETHCADCGLVIASDEIDQGEDWRTYEGGNDQSRVGAPKSVLSPDHGLMTTISHANADFAGRSLSGVTRSQFYRLRKWQRRTTVHNRVERNMQKALLELDRIIAALGLTRAAKEEAAAIYRKAAENDLIRGRSIDTVVAASVYLANQKLELSRSFDDIVSVSPCRSKDISRAHRLIKQRLKIRTVVPSPTVYVSRYCSELGLDTAVINHTHTIINRASELGLVHGKSPSGVAAACLYIACRETSNFRTQSEIADVTYVTEVTIRNRYKEIAANLGIDL